MGEPSGEAPAPAAAFEDVGDEASGGGGDSGGGGGGGGAVGGASKAGDEAMFFVGGDEERLSSGFIGGASLAAALLLQALTRAARVMDPAHVGLFHLYYSPLMCCVVAFALWGCNLWVWHRLRIHPSPLALFELDDRSVHLSHHAVFKAAGAAALFLLGSAAAFAFFAAQQRLWLAAAQPLLAYAVFAGGLVVPANVLHRKTRSFFLKTLWRMLAPVQSISFADFLLADILTSLAKALSDMERAVCAMGTGQVMEALRSEDVVARCGSASWQIPVCLAVPYAIRLAQCLRQYHDTNEPLCLFNALKYTSSFPVILLSALKYHVRVEAWREVYKPAWLLFATLNSLFSCLWDVRFDWDMTLALSATRGLKVRRRSPTKARAAVEPLYPTRSFYSFALVSNLFARVAWIYKLSAHLRHNHGTVLAISLLELLRRFQWIFLRVETAYHQKLGTLPLVTHNGSV